MFCVSGHFPPVLGPELPEWTDVRDAPMLFSRIRPRLDRTLPARPRMPKSIAVSLRPPPYDDDDTEGRPRPGGSAIDAPTAPLRHENRLHLASPDSPRCGAAGEIALALQRFVDERRALSNKLPKVHFGLVERKLDVAFRG